MKFSVIIPSRNRPERLRLCLEAISRLHYPLSEFEVIVADDGNPRPLRDIVGSTPFSRPFALRFLRQPHSGPAIARNLAAASAGGSWLVFIDDDCLPQPDWLQKFDQAVDQQPDCLLAGSTRNGCPGNPFAETNQNLLNLAVDWFEKTGSPLRFYPTNNMVVPANGFRAIGGFNENFRIAAGEDREFCHRWLVSGRRMSRAPDAWIDHYHPQTLTRFLEMHLRYGRGAALLHRSRSSSAISSTSWAFYKHLFQSIRTGGRRAAGWLLPATLLALSQAAVAGGFFFERTRPGSRIKPLPAPQNGRTHPEG